MSSTGQNEILLRVEILGPLRLNGGGADQSHTPISTQKAGTLLTYLALRLGPHSREYVVDLLWPDMKPSAGRNNLSTTLVSLRRQLEPPGVRRGSVLLASQAEVGLNPETVVTDAA